MESEKIAYCLKKIWLNDFLGKSKRVGKSVKGQIFLFGGTVVIVKSDLQGKFCPKVRKGEKRTLMSLLYFIHCSPFSERLVIIH
jgi:hypothetical protein